MILAIDQSTSATKVFAVGQGGIMAEYAINHRQRFPKAGWVEFDADEVYANLLRCVESILSENNFRAGDFEGIAITNQRESVVCWDADSLKPICPAVSWQCLRGTALAQTLNGDAEYIFDITGMELSPAYSAAKLMWIAENIPHAKRARMGTVDAYLINRLTRGERFMTDISNAGRTQLMNVRTREWDARLADMFGLNMRALPTIAQSDADFGIARESALAGVPILAVMGDSQASLFAQGAFSAGDVKVSYGTGSSVMMQLGGAPKPARGLTSTPAWGYRGETNYVLEGNITHSGDTFAWLRDEIGLFSDMNEFTELVKSVKDAGGVSLVPALTGLGAPHFDTRTRGLICGLSRGTTRAHIARAAMEAICLQISDCLRAMENSSGARLNCLLADGGGARNAEMMRFQAGILDLPVKVYSESAGSALGAAIMAGAKTGLYKDYADAVSRLKPQTIYAPDMDESERARRLEEWRSAIARARYLPCKECE